MSDVATNDGPKALKELLTLGPAPRRRRSAPRRASSPSRQRGHTCPLCHEEIVPGSRNYFDASGIPTHLVCPIDDDLNGTKLAAALEQKRAARASDAIGSDRRDRGIDTEPRGVVSSKGRNGKAPRGAEDRRSRNRQKEGGHQMAEEKTVEIKVEPGTCEDGCGLEVTKGRRFRQGHDARLRGILGRAYKAGQPVAFVMNGTRKESSAEAALKSHGFPIPPAKKASTKKSTTKKTTAKRPASKRATAKRGGKPTTRKPKASAAK